jgi:hypothetical protein
MSKERCQQYFKTTERKVDELNGMLNIHIQLRICVHSTTGVLFSGMWRRVVWYKFTEVREERNASVFWVEELSRASARNAKWDKQRKRKYSADCLAYSSTLKMEALSSFEMSVNFYQTTRRYIRRQQYLYSLSWEHQISHIPYVRMTKKKLLLHFIRNHIRIVLENPPVWWTDWTDFNIMQILELPI